jgi:hypothetical protein
MLLVESKAMVTYTCTLTDEDEQKVRHYAKENNLNLNEAIQALWESEEIDIYAGNQTESECLTEEVGYSEFNEEADIIA